LKSQLHKLESVAKIHDRYPRGVTMFERNIFAYLAILSITFISVGDRILPHPYGKISTDIREKIDRTALGLFPQIEIGSNSNRVWQEEREYSGDRSN
jgi:hypothetical protein